MAVKLRPAEGAEMDMLGTTNPAFATRTPEEFLELLQLRAPDPETGQPDMEKLGAFLAAHPESQPAIQATIGAEPPASLAQLAFRSPHSFKFVNADGDETWLRYHWRPEAGESRIPDDEARERGRDYLSEELAERLRGGPVGFELVLQLAGEGDPLDDPTAIWPDDREEAVAGRLEVTEIIDDPESGDHIEVFDPVRVVDGIELSNDPILHARPRVYSVSAYRRLGVETDSPSIPPHEVESAP
jgi:catalase